MATNTRYPFDHRKAIRTLSREDRRLARLMERVGRFRLEMQPAHSPFESLLEAIVYQQLNGKAAATILARVKNLFPLGRFPRPEEILKARDSALRSAGLSRQKIAALRDLAAKACDGTIPTLAAIRRMADAEIVERLTSIHGVGIWTVEMFLIFRMGRPDVLPVHDYGIRKGFALTFRCKEVPKPQEVAARGERWRPYRTVASWYLWRALDAPARKPSRTEVPSPKDRNLRQRKTLDIENFR